MRQNPCSSCRHFNVFETGAMSCYAVRDPKFYWPDDADKMLAQCPLGWRAKKSGNKDFDYYRDYENVHKMG